MAGNGMTIIQAINEMVETVNEFPMATDGAIPSGTGTSIYHRARQFLDRESKRVQALGWPENTSNGQAETADGSGKVDVAGTWLQIKGSGPDAHRDLSMRLDGANLRVYDNNKGTFAVTSASGNLFLDIVEAIGNEASCWGFADLSPQLQDAIIAEAKMKFQLRIQGNMDLHTTLREENLIADAAAPRNNPVNDQRHNVVPLAAKMQPRQQGK